MKHNKNSAFAYRTVETDRTFAYDAGKLLSSTETEASCGTCVYTYEYDLMGNRTAAVKTNTAGTVVENRKYVYNESNQLAVAVLCDGNTTRKVQHTYPCPNRSAQWRTGWKYRLTISRWIFEPAVEWCLYDSIIWGLCGGNN